MFRFRHAHVEALRIGWIRTGILDLVARRLVEARLLAAAEIELVRGQPMPAERSRVLADLLEADARGVRSEDGLIQFASYRFEFGDDWMQRPRVKQALAYDADEDALLDAIFAALATTEEGA